VAEARVSPLRATLGGTPFSVDDVEALARAPATLVLSEAARSAVAEAHAIVERSALGDEPVYGLNTGLGANLAFRIARDEVDGFQEQMVRGRVIGVGEPLPEAVCRAALIVRCIGLSKGGAGVSPALLELLLAMVERGVTPVIPRRGSIGAGDLGLAAHMAAVVIGRGEAWHEGRRLPGDAALAAAGLAPITLVGRDGHALCNTSAVSTAHAVVTLADTARLTLFAMHAAALACEGFGANASVLDPRIAAIRPAARQEDAAALFRHLLEGSSLEQAVPRRVQDPLSFRCLAQIVGVALHALDWARREVEVELAATSDSPVVLPDGTMLSTANFHTPALALAFDSLAIAHAHLATASFQRVARLLDPDLTGLPRYLSPVGGGSAGYVPVQKLGASLVGEVRLAATPASLDAMPVSDSFEDVAPQTPLAIGKLADQLEPLRMLYAVEALVAAQAVDLREGARLAAPTKRLYDALRSVVGRLDADREPAPDLEHVVALAADRELLADLASSLDGLDLPFLPRYSALADLR
jgi:histidine ammonia-lyase